MTSWEGTTGGRGDEHHKVVGNQPVYTQPMPARATGNITATLQRDCRSGKGWGQNRQLSLPGSTKLPHLARRKTWNLQSRVCDSQNRSVRLALPPLPNCAVSRTF